MHEEVYELCMKMILGPGVKCFCLNKLAGSLSWFYCAWGETGIKCAINMLVHILGSHAARAHEEKNVDGIRCVSQWLSLLWSPTAQTECCLSLRSSFTPDIWSIQQLTPLAPLVCLSPLVSFHVFYVHLLLSASLLWYPPFFFPFCISFSLSSSSALLLLLSAPFL